MLLDRLDRRLGVDLVEVDWLSTDSAGRFSNRDLSDKRFCLHSSMVPSVVRANPLGGEFRQDPMPDEEFPLVDEEAVLA